MKPRAYLVPVGHYRPGVVKDCAIWVTDRYDVRVYLGQKVTKVESFDTYEVADLYCRWLENGLSRFLAPVTC